MVLERLSFHFISVVTFHMMALYLLIRYYANLARLVQ